MIDHRRYRWVSLLALIALLFAALAVPGSGSIAQATPTAERTDRPITRAERAALQSEDAALVQASLQHPIQDDVFYFVLPDRFENGDPANNYGDDPGGTTTADILRHGFHPTDKGYFHGGDLKGLMSQLDYLEQMGVTAIWMTPVFKNRPVQGDGTIAGSSAGYHGYWITDFTQIDPHLGTNEELRALIADAHTRGMKVFFDIITNHTADVIDYEEGEYRYRNKTNFPYRDASGREFDDRDYAGGDTFPELDAATSFPYTPVFRNPADATVKVPAWLNNPIYYHNRGDSTFAGESSEYGDFFGLDDLFTEHPRVVDGMIDIYKFWISEFKIDGFRIDTVKHVNMEFWQAFGPAIMEHAKSEGIEDFFMYGEVFSGDPAFKSRYTTEGQLPAVLDFGFQGASRNFASQSGPTNNLRNFFELDDYYTDADSNAYSMPVFIGNHDMGRFGLFLNQDNRNASDAELLARSKLAHALMFTARGMPVVYYGDEQGFTGDGGDKDARENMFPSQVASYNDNNLIGTDATTADDNFDADHPIYQAIAAYSGLHSDNLALRRGAQIHRYSTGEAGIYAFSRIEREEKVEYVVAFNNATSAKSATFATYSPNTGFSAVYPNNAPALTSGANAEISVTVPALSFVVYKADRKVPESSAAPEITASAPQAGATVTGRVEVGANLDRDILAEVTFAVQAGDGAYEVIGTDTNAPYRVFYDVSNLEVGTPLTFKAIVNDLSGNLNSTTVAAVVGQDGSGGGGGDCPAPNYAIIHYNRPDGDYEGWGLHLWGDAIDPEEATEWTAAKAPNGEDEYGVFWFIKLQDASQPVNYIIHKGDEKDTDADRSFTPSENAQIWVKQGDGANYTSAAAAQGFVRVHYNRPDGDYEGWGLHLWGDAIAPEEATEWSDPKLPDGQTGYGVYFTIQIQDATQPVNFIIHKGDEKDTDADRSFIPSENASIWLKQGDATNYASRAAAQQYVVIHYHRPDGDYGDPTSDNYNDFWGLHVWTGAAQPTEWTAPIKPAGTDRFGVYFRVPLAADATTLSYILHRGDEKDLPEDQELDLTEYGNEVWILQATPGYLLPTAACEGVEPCVAQVDYAIIHYNRPDGDYEGWGLHLWGDAIDPSEVTEWTAAKAPNGEDEYGVFWFIKLQDATQPVNYIIHKGDEKDTDADRSFNPSQTPQIWVKQGDGANYTSAAAAQGYVTIRYQRTDGDYGSGNDYWGLHLWGDAIADGVATDWSAPRPRDGVDAYGAYFNVPIKDSTQPVNFIVHKPSGDDVPETREPGGDRSFIPDEGASIWLLQGDEAVYTSRGAAEGFAILHYHRDDGDYGDFSSNNYNDFWGLHVWTGAAQPTEWTAPLKPAGRDGFGIYFKVPLADDATTLSYIIHKGDEKDLPEDQELDLATYGHEVWILQATPEYLLPIVNPCGPGGGSGNLNRLRAHWVAADTIAWNIEGGAGNTYELHYAPEGGLSIADGEVVGGQSITLSYDSNGLSSAIRAKFPHLANFAALRVSADDRAKIPAILKGQIAVSATGSNGALVDAAGLQIPGVLDDLYTYEGELGVVYQGDAPTIKLWAPTAKSVTLHLFANSTAAEPSYSLEMEYDGQNGVWSRSGNASWNNRYYLFEVEVYVPSTGRVERNFVTDPYSVSLSMNSTRSQIVNLRDARLKPRNWDRLRKPALAAPEDIVLYELHVRDFSITDESVRAANRGTFKAFTERGSRGMRHLAQLARAGLTHVHLLPVFDIATINEDKSQRVEPDAALLASLPPDSDRQQAIIDEVRDQDGFNWGYDPYHYTVPEGSYSTNPDGTTRIVEFREMVQSLNQVGLRVVVDVVYNHTNSSGQNEKSVLDRVVPGYYHRLDGDGNVTTSTCCANTATEHAMMEKLMVDSLVVWARDYKVDGFRFDLMGHHMKSNMLKVRAALDALTLERDGVDGKRIYVYGEGWNFGEVENNQRGVNAAQLNMAGTGIGTFNDRLRDGVRGGGPFDTQDTILRNQGFINGLYTFPNDYNRQNRTPEEQKAQLLQYTDWIKIGLTGNLRDYQLIDRNGARVTGAQIDYNGSPAGYTADPQETITYIEAHDNETLFDIIQLKAPVRTSLDTRVRMQNLGMSVVMLGQGVPFVHAGQELLRSKSMDRNSYNSGDWFNRLDWTYRTNNWGVGLPPQHENGRNWYLMQPLLANPALKPGQPQIQSAARHFEEMLRIRSSSKLFRLGSAEEVQRRVAFLNNGPNQVPGLIVMTIDDTVGANLDRQYKGVVVIFNASGETQRFGDASFRGQRIMLHPIQNASADRVVRESRFDPSTGTFSVPPRTTAVFVVR